MIPFLQVHRVIRENKPAKSYVETHSHPFYQCIFGISGMSEVLINGEQRYMVGKDHLLIIPPKDEHAVITKEGFSSIEIMFSCSGIFEEALYDRTQLFLEATLSIRSIMYEIVNEASLRKHFCQEMINFQMAQALLALLRAKKELELQAAGEDILGFHYSGWNSLPEHIRNSPIRNALLYIESNLDKKISISELAELCGYDKNYFSCVFQNYINGPPSWYIKNRKINAAKAMLITSDDSITTISRKLGYDSIHYFSRAFKSVEGVSPTDYAKRLRQALAVNLSEDKEFPPTGEFQYQIRRWSECDEVELKPEFERLESANH